MNGRSTEEHPLEELEGLATTAGARVVGTLTQRREAPDVTTYLGSGKVEELQRLAAAADADVVVFDNDLSPAQARNLEQVIGLKVLDRSELILDIFATRAQTYEARLAVELAQLQYSLPRLKRMWTHLSRIKAGIGMRGPGEKQLEVDRRLVEKRIHDLSSELKGIHRRKERQVASRDDRMTVSLVGYTNAGKSTLFNRITGAHVLQSSQMFATLDPKLRAIELPSRRKVLLSDTVGFIRNLPHTLVTSFRATLEEVEQAEVLVHIRNAASSYGDEQKAQVERVLGELNALSKPRVEVLNKIDLLGPHEQEGLASRSQSDPPGIPEVFVSARTGEGIESLLAAIDQALYSDPLIEAELRVPQHEGAALAAIEAGMVIHKREYEGNLVRLTVAGPASLMGRFRQFRLSGGASSSVPRNV